MADVVINHSSSRGLWFKNYLKNKSPGKNYFFTIDKKFNSTNVVRPREHPLLKKINIFNKNLANIETKKGHEKNKALAVASCI